MILSRCLDSVNNIDRFTRGFQKQHFHYRNNSLYDYLGH